MGADAEPKQWNAKFLWRSLLLPRFSMLHLLVFGGAILLISDWRMRYVCPSAPGKSTQAFLPVDRPPECSSRDRVPRQAVSELVLKAQRGIEEAEEARGTDMNLEPQANQWGIPMANSTLLVNGKTLTFDDILYGYDLMFENLAMFAHTSWFGVASQQDPSDAFALSSLLWRVQPDLLIELGTNTGGGAIFYATVMREYNPNSLVLTIDPKDPAIDWSRANKGCSDCVDVRCTSIWHTHVEFLKGLSRDPHVLARVRELAKTYSKVIVMHDGSHFYEDVFEDLKVYDEITSVGSYMVVQDTKMTRMYKPLNGDGFPLGAAQDFMAGQGKGRYEVDKGYEFLLYSQHHNGFLRKVRA
eukprot:TRINITY_DN48292_c0_g1_i1.p1 TRINITY_DN48292_c0_g1~~TRINITY_DN48292_c0_g1_i1.p1  ORF type:complete len:356 (-),score=34.80 TRINITY_DN48292_c0_g1_i1:93-1160(-)